MLPSLKNNLTIIFRCEKTLPRTSTRKFSCKWRPKPEIWKRKMSNKLRRGPELNFHYSFRLGQRLTENLAIFLFVVLRSGRVCFVARHRFCKKKQWYLDLIICLNLVLLQMDYFVLMLCADFICLSWLLIWNRRTSWLLILSAYQKNSIFKIFRMRTSALHLGGSDDAVPQQVLLQEQVFLQCSCFSSQSLNVKVTSKERTNTFSKCSNRNVVAAMFTEVQE